VVRRWALLLDLAVKAGPRRAVAVRGRPARPAAVPREGDGGASAPLPDLGV